MNFMIEIATQIQKTIYKNSYNELCESITIGIYTVVDKINTKEASNFLFFLEKKSVPKG
jgi:hypothetical protein